METKIELEVITNQLQSSLDELKRKMLGRNLIHDYITEALSRVKKLNEPAVSGSYSIEEDIKHRIEKWLIDGKLKPIKCECGSTEFYDKITDRVESAITEKDRYCKNCNKLVGCWSYGYWLP